MAKCGNCGHEKHLHTLGFAKCKASDCSCWSFVNAFKRFINYFKK